MHSPLGFRYATAAALIDREGYTGEETEHLLREWERYARYAMMSGKTPVSTAEHLARFERYQRGAPLQRDPKAETATSASLAASPRPYTGRSLLLRVPDIDVDTAIADDLRMHATTIYDDDPEHAREILAVARRIQNERDPSGDKPRIAADVVRRNTERDVARTPRCARGTEIVSLIFPSDFDERSVRTWTRKHGFTSDALEFPRTTGSIRAPQRDTRDFEPGSFRTIVLNVRENIRAVIGCPRAGRESDKTKRSRA